VGAHVCVHPECISLLTSAPQLSMDVAADAGFLCTKDAMLWSVINDTLYVCTEQQVQHNSPLFIHITLIPSLVQYQRQEQCKTCQLQVTTPALSTIWAAHCEKWC
jgi:hypothetical protein